MGTPEAGGDGSGWSVASRYRWARLCRCGANRGEREEGLAYERSEVVLLKDIHTVWGLEEAFIPTGELVERLVHHSPQMWGMASTFANKLSAQRLGRMLVKGYDIHSDRAPHGKRERGYQRSRFEPAFRAFELGHSE